jgi:hypothetical protein
VRATAVTATTDIAAFNSGATGGGAAHNVMPPYLVVSGWLIRT